MHQAKLLLVTHPNEEKNLGIEQEFDKFARSMKDKKIQMLYMNGHNENESFKAPRKLPTLLYFRQGLPLDEDPV